MTQSYSLDLRVRVVAFVEAGHSCRTASRPFGGATGSPSSCCSTRGNLNHQP
jgi:hypothetical protein